MMYHIHKVLPRSDIYLTDGRIIPLPRGAYDKLNRAIIHMK